MAGLREFFLRLRLAGAPGAPTGTAVPRDRLAERDAELSGVFDALAAAQARAAGIREDARVEAEGIRQGASREAAAIVRDARQSVPTLCEDTARRAKREAGVTAAEIVARGRERADAVRRHAAAHLPGFVEDTVSSIAASLAPESPRADTRS